MKQVSLTSTDPENLHAFIKYVEHVYPRKSAIEGWGDAILPEAYGQITRDIYWAEVSGELTLRVPGTPWYQWPIEEFKKNIARVYAGFDIENRQR